jgi:hypothetical protein
MNAFFARNRGMLGGLAGVICASAIVLGTAFARSSGEQPVTRTFEQEKAVALQAIAVKQDLVVRGRACLERAQSVDEMSDCLDAEYKGKTELDERLHPLKSRPETLAEDPGII